MKWLHSASARALFVALMVGFGLGEMTKSQAKDPDALGEVHRKADGVSETTVMIRRTSTPFQVVPPTKETLPLLAMMINLEQNLAALQAGIWRGDYETISNAADGLVSHGKLDDREIQKIRTILGDEGLKQFVAADTYWHDKAEELARAAKGKTLETITNATAEMIQSCCGCHVKYRTPLRDNPKWLE